MKPSRDILESLEKVQFDDDADTDDENNDDNDNKKSRLEARSWITSTKLKLSPMPAMHFGTW